MDSETPASVSLSLFLLGPFRATIRNEPLPESRTKKTEALLAYLALNANQTHRRENLVGFLFPDMPDDVARTNLRQSLTRLRRAIQDQDADPSFLLITRESVQFNLASDHYLDVAAFQRLQAGCPDHAGRRDSGCPACMIRAQQALDLFRQPFLDGFFLEDSAAFDEWVLSQREQLHETALTLATQLADFYERRGDYAAAEMVARRQIQLEPWREEAHRQLMRLLAYQGRRGDALRQYERLAELLITELDLEPMPATEQLRRQIVSATDERSNNLPLRDPSFVGRAGELATIHEHLVDPERRLVTLFGPGGSGKTALAVETGWQATRLYLGPFIHGVFMVPLSGIDAPAGPNAGNGSTYDPLLTAVAEALAFSPSTDPAAELVSYLADKRLLLILDNAEHLLKAVCDLVLDLLRGTSTVQVLVTSRTRLGLADEWLVEVGGLPVPDLSSDEMTADNDAPQLFLQRAQRLAPEIASASGSSACPRSAIVRICQLVQGLPLGVELAASWVRLLSCPEIVVELEKNLDFLRSSTAGVEARHQSLRAVFDYSWSLLEDADRQTLGRLAVFSGSFDRLAAQSVTGATVQGLVKLVDYSLLRRQAAAAGIAQRYEVLETLRHFAAEKQEASATGSDHLNERYSRYYLDFLATRLDELRGERQLQTVKEIALEISNIRSAWRLAIERDDLPALAGAQESLAIFYYMRSWFAEGESSFALASKQVGAGHSGPQRDVLWAKLMAWHGWFCTLRGQIAEGHELLQQATALLRRCHANSDLGGVLPYLAIATSSSGDYATAEALAREARQLGEQRDDHYVQAVTANVLSQIMYLQGDYRQAREFGQESLLLQRQSGNLWTMAFSLSNLGRAAFAEADYRRASVHYQEAIEIRETLGDARGKALGLLYLGDATLAEGEPEAAKTAYQASLDIFREIGSRSGSAEALNRLGRVAAQEAESLPARRHFVEALELARSGQAIRPMLGALWGMAQLLASEAAEDALVAAQVVALHPTTGATVRLAAEELVSQLAPTTGIDIAEEFGPTLTPNMVDEVAGRLLAASRVS